MNLIEAAKLVGIEIPHYCYHPGLSIAGNCRMCLVEFGTPALGLDRKPILNPDGRTKIAESPRPAIACATPISPGMEIYTGTPAVRQMREGVLEFLLISHPLDCPICDKAGECYLQDHYDKHGRYASRFLESKEKKEKKEEEKEKGKGKPKEKEKKEKKVKKEEKEAPKGKKEKPKKKSEGRSK